MPRKSTPQPEPVTVEPLELHIQLVGIQRRGEEIVGKEVMAQGVVPPADFSNLPKLLKEAITEHQAAAELANAEADSG